MFSTAFPTSIKSAIGLLYSLIFAISSSIGITINYTTAMPTAEDDFEPAIRFVVCTDSHNNNENIVDMIETCYSIFGEDGIDLFVHAGDFTEIGTDKEMKAFGEAWYGAINGRSESLVILGNHDLKSGYDADERFANIFGASASEQHILVNGFHFIGIPSYTQSAIQLAPPSKITWASKALAEAESDSDNLPVFVIQHPHNAGTVYGSVIWGTVAYSSVWNGHNRVVNFSGHSHFPISDPRSIWQGSYTALGAGAMERFELEKDLIWSQHPDGYESAAEFLVVEADNDGSVKIDAYDLNTDTFFRSYYIENVNDTSTFAYTYKNRLAYDDAPIFADNTHVEYTINENDEFILTFDKATDKLVMHDYKITVFNNLGFPVHLKTYLSDYFMQGTPDTMSINLGDLDLSPNEKFTVKIVATNAYYEVSEPLKVTFN